MAGTGRARDPVSVAFDASARRQLARALGSRGQWVSFWLPDPDMRQRTRWLEQGIDVGGPDPLPKGGGLDARTRWGRAFCRSLHYQLKWFAPARGSRTLRGVKRTTGSSTPLRIEIGRHVPGNPSGSLPPRRRVRIQVPAGGKARDRAVARLANSDRIYAPDGRPAARWGDERYRDW